MQVRSFAKATRAIACSRVHRASAPVVQATSQLSGCSPLYSKADSFRQPDTNSATVPNHIRPTPANICYSSAAATQRWSVEDHRRAADDAAQADCDMEIATAVDIAASLAKVRSVPSTTVPPVIPDVFGLYSYSLRTGFVRKEITAAGAATKSSSVAHVTPPGAHHVPHTSVPSEEHKVFGIYSYSLQSGFTSLRYPEAWALSSRV
mmetsp:Transcript_60534/g.194936  ORF Transcript_60534/g.194936 Transcript_60534/m.194936 type:complete len:206 (+) Transcript_60534:87-704(+)